mmetsp:Transcript_1295/g.3983  ORF Transcript_1295/g.3983 Transcript_1295/m.3983 type:complete len:98 (-) Transcript_1295:430-723(-)
MRLMRCTRLVPRLHVQQAQRMESQNHMEAAAHVTVAQGMMDVQNSKTFVISSRCKCNCCILSWIDMEEPKGWWLQRLEGLGVLTLETLTTFLHKRRL